MKLDLTSRPDVLTKGNLRLATNQPVASLARPITPLTVNTSIPRAIETLRQSNIELYPVVGGNRLLLLISESDLSRILFSLSQEEQDEYRKLTLSAIIDDLITAENHPPTLYATETLGSALTLFGTMPSQSVVGVVDKYGAYYGVLSRKDLMAASFRTLAPSRVGGMATPLGVYLTDGVDSGGVGNGALMLGGASLMALFIVAVTGANMLQTVAYQHHIDVWGGVIHVLMPIMPSYAAAFVSDMQTLIPLVVMLMLLRAIPVAGYHAAEHQVVHCIERGEPLLAEKVATMPRPHPRCGTNLVAAVTLFGVYFSLFAGILQSYTGAIAPSAVLTLLTWRQVGTFFQQYFTTRKASLKQINSGIAAGEDLLMKYRQNTNRQVKLPLRIWRMGFLQMLIGCTIFGLVLWTISNLVPQLKPLLQGIN